MGLSEEPELSEETKAEVTEFKMLLCPPAKSSRYVSSNYHEHSVGYRLLTAWQVDQQTVGATYVTYCQCVIY